MSPIITLSGSATINLNQGDVFNDAGAIASDDVDGDISANIIVGGDSVDTATAGSYIVTYNVSDAAGNLATQVTRTINVGGLPVTSTYIMPPLNDTGVLIGGNYPTGNNIGCTGETIAEQDCSLGRDKQAADGALAKVGAGSAGFDFTKLGSNGTPLAIQNQAWNDLGNESAGTIWSCVKDNHTNLIWEVKVNSVQGGGLHSKEDLFFWYSTDASNNGGTPGVDKNPNGTSTCTGQNQNDSGTFCNTQAFIARVNAENLCGDNDWRLPNLHESLSIIDYGKATSPAMDTDFFPNDSNASFLDQWYWTSTPWVVNTGDTTSAINDDEGGVVNGLRNFANSARLVRAAQ